MDYLNYNELVDSLRALPTQREQVDGIIQYFKENVMFDYIMIEHINEIVTLRFVRYVDRLFPNTTEQFRTKALAFVKNSTNISDGYWERIKNLYLTPLTNDAGEEYYITMEEALTGIEPEYIEENGLLKKGTAEHITSFAKKLCDELGIPCLIVKGISSGHMKHYWLDVCVDDEELFYDITYALYIRDNFCGIGKRYNAQEWLGISPKQLYKNQCTRKITYPFGFSLEYLGLNNLPLDMKRYFDNSAS